MSLQQLTQVSMENLQQGYDAVVMGTRSNKKADSSSALPCLGRLLLCLVGQLRFGDSWCSMAYCFLAWAVLPFSLMALLVYDTSVSSGLMSKWSLTMALTLCLFQLAISFASFSFMRQDMSRLLGPTERQLDDYAQQRGFVEEWQRRSWRRLGESICALLTMLLARILVNLSLGDPWVGNLGGSGLDNEVFTWSLWFVALRFLLYSYSVLHLSSGFELAVDSFSVRFFNQMDIEETSVLLYLYMHQSCPRHGEAPTNGSWVARNTKDIPWGRSQITKTHTHTHLCTLPSTLRLRIFAPSSTRGQRNRCSHRCDCLGVYCAVNRATTKIRSWVFVGPGHPVAPGPQCQRQIREEWRNGL